MPVHTMAYWSLDFVNETSLAYGRAAYSALLMFPGAQSLRFEPLLRTVKCQWNHFVPKYMVYCDVPKLLEHVANLPATAEIEIWRHLILCLRFFALFRSVDHQRTKRTLERRVDVCLIWAQCKGRPASECYPLHPIDAFPWGAWPRDAAADTRKQAGRQSTALTRASLRSCHVTKRFRILAILKQGNKSMYSNTSGYVHMGLSLDWGKCITEQ